jgi:transposase-like protein
MNKPYKLADSVLHRVIQMLQEAMLMGVDVADLMRQMQLVPDASDSHVLVLTEDYLEQVKRWHKQLLEDADKLTAEIKGEDPNAKKLIMS